MQGTAKNATEALYYEFLGTVAELITADCLLRGNTPLEDTKEFLRVLKLMNPEVETSGRSSKSFSVDASTKVLSSSNPASMQSVMPLAGGHVRGTEMKECDNLKKMTNVRKEQAKFCATSMIIFNISEAASIVLTSAYLVTTGAIGGGTNPSR